MGLKYQPDFYITANDSDVTDVIKKNLVSLSLTDNSGDEIDQLTITVQLPNNVKSPQKGDELRIGIGFKGHVVNKGKFIVDEVSSSGPPRLVNIVADAAPLAKKSTMQTQKTKTFDDLTFGDLINEISSKHNLKPKVSAGIGVLRFEHIDQTTESDMSLLLRMAKQNNAIVAVKNDSLILMKRDEGKTVTGKPLQTISLTPNQVSSWQCVTGSRGEAKKVTATYIDVASGKEKEITVGTGEPELRMVNRFSSKKEAESAIKARFDIGESGASTLSVSMPVVPSVLPLVAEGKLSLSGFGDIEDQTWTVKKLAWSLSSSGFTLSISAEIGAKPKQEVKKIV